MRATVLKDLKLARRAGRFVWLSIDAEDARNAGFLERFPVTVFPSFFVIDASSERAVLSYTGSATRTELLSLLADGESRARTGPEAILAQADAEQAGGHLDAALASYRRALAQGGLRWAKRPRVIESLVLALSGAERAEECAEVAWREGPSLPRGPSFANVVGSGLSCATGIADGTPARDAALAALVPLAWQALSIKDLLADDRSSLYEAIVDAHKARGDLPGARRVAEAWWRFLEKDARRAGTKEEHAALDSARVEAALTIGDPARALPSIEESARDFPWDYNPKARLARLLFELGRLGEARASAEEAVGKAYGPRKLVLYRFLVRILEAQGDRSSERATLDEAVTFGEGLPAAQRKDELLFVLRAKREALKQKEGAGDP
ncbi:MAG TPA: hypothetical protein VLV17_03605 [Anaeromyxobacteraceae bacterium]|nr:hypothetical protein [Anaeromyxobacteraceae bacterium]